MAGHARSGSTRLTRFMRVSASALALMLATDASRADDGVDLARGEAIAAAKCAKCHAVGPAGDSPQRGVPPFRTLIQYFPIPMLEQTLRTGVVDGHEEMPMFELGFVDVRNLLAYIDSLNAAGPAYVKRK